MKQVKGNLSSTNAALAQTFTWPKDPSGNYYALGKFPTIAGIPKTMFDYLTAHPETFRVERRFTFSHVYLNPERRRDSLARDATQLLARLKQAGAGADLAALGDPFLLDHEFNRMAASDVVHQFGERFATKLGELPLGEWQGPLESGYGAHLVLVNERTEGRLPALGEVRDSVRREWQNVQRLEANEKFFQGLLDRYTVVVEQERPVHAEGKIAAVKPR